MRRSLPGAWLVGLLGLLVLLAACDSFSSPQFGSLEVRVTTSGVDPDPDGYLLNVPGGSSRIAANDTVTLESVPAGTRRITLDDLAFNCDVSSETSTVRVTKDALSTIDLTVSCPAFLSNAILYSTRAFGAGIAFGSQQLMAMRPDGTRRTRLTEDRDTYNNAVVSPDGRRIAASLRLEHLGWDGIYLLDADGTGRTQLVQRSPADGQPAWSPDGTQLAFVSDHFGPFGQSSVIYLIGADGTGLRQLTPDDDETVHDRSPDWSPDGSRLLFSRDHVLHVIDADGSDLQSLDIEGDDASWSPDGTRIAYSRGVVTTSGDDEIWILRLDGSAPVRLTTNNVDDDKPRWSPDGEWLVFERSEFPLSQIYRMRIDGTSVQRLSDGSASELSPSWGPLP